MKCPKCGFVSYPGLTQCRKCGHKFPPAAPQESRSLNAPLFAASPPPPVTPPASVPAPAAQSPQPQEEETTAPSPQVSPAQAVPATPESPASEAKTPEPSPPWREELAERVESFRRRRAQLKRGGDSSQNLHLDFEKAEEAAELPELEGRVLEFPQSDAPLDVELETSPGLESELPILETSPPEKGVGETRLSGSAALEAESIPPDRGKVESELVEIFVGPPEPAVPAAALEETPPVLPLAPLGRRFLAGLADTLVLLVGAGLFMLIFWRAGGHLRPDPLNLTVVGFMAVFFILLYFGLFTAFTFSTPGLLWVGLEVRNFEGAYPTMKESFWRAFGYLVSISALMLGFVWAVVDSEGLTWHDRMSGTFITLAVSR